MEGANENSADAVAAAAAAATAGLSESLRNALQGNALRVGASAAALNAASTSLPSILASAALPSTVASAAARAAAVPYFPWPPHQPIINVPFFDSTSYKAVNLDVQPSCLPSGMDLPLNDITTLRFFFNMGINHARAVLLSHHVQAALTAAVQPQQTANALQFSNLNATQIGGNSMGIPQNPIGISATALQNDQQLQLLNQFRAQQMLNASQKMCVSEKVSDAQQPQLSRSVQLPTQKSADPSTVGIAFPPTSSSPQIGLEALLLQNALLANTNENRSLNELAQLRYQLALNASAQNLFSSSTSSLSQSSPGHELIKPIAVNGSEVQRTNSQPNESHSPLPRIPVDPAPRSESALERTIRLVQQGIQNSVAVQQLNELQQQALLSLRTNAVDSTAALHAAQLAAAVAAGQHARDAAAAAHSQQIPSLLSNAAAMRAVPSSTTQSLPIRPTPTHVSTSVDDIPPSHSLLAATERHYNETFKMQKNAETRATNGGNQSHEQSPPATKTSTASVTTSADHKFDEHDDQRNGSLHPQMMINLLNGVLSKFKNELHHQGVGVHMDPSGRPIDFSARPVDPIFRKAREQLENSREYRDSASPPAAHHIALDRPRSFSIKEAEMVRMASERLQQGTSSSQHPAGDSPAGGSGTSDPGTGSPEVRVLSRGSPDSSQSTITVTTTGEQQQCLQNTPPMFATRKYSGCMTSSGDTAVVDVPSVRSSSCSEPTSGKRPKAAGSESGSPPSGEKRPRIACKIKE